MESKVEALKEVTDSMKRFHEAVSRLNDYLKNETQIEKLESELHAEIKLRMQREEECKEEFQKNRELQEENTRLKELIGKAYKEGAGTGCYYETDDEEFIKEQCQEFLKSHNIEYTKQ